MQTLFNTVHWRVFWLALRPALRPGLWPICWLAAGLSWAVVLPAAANPSATLSVPSVQEFPATEPEFETLRDAETIDNKTITALVQDQRGLIWIGTQHGLVRYDGYRFRKFVRKATDPFSLAGDYIFSLSVADDGRLWVGTLSDGISVFDSARERFEHFRHDATVPHSLSGGSIPALTSDGRGGMWIVTNRGLDYLPAGSQRFVHFKHGDRAYSLQTDKVRCLLLDKAGRLWVGGLGGLQRLSRDGKHFETILTGRSVLTLFQAQDGKLWLGTRQHGVGWLDAGSSGGAASGTAAYQIHWPPLAQPNPTWIHGIAQANQDQIWLASSGGGIFVVAAKDGKPLQTLRHDPLLPGSLAFDTPKPMLSDRSGWLWVGTWGAGLQRTNTNNTMLRILRHSPQRPAGLSQPDVPSVLELADGRLAIGTASNGIDIYDRQQGTIKGYRTVRGQLGTLPEAAISALAQTGDGSIWAGTRQAGVVRLLPGSSVWLTVPGLPDKAISKLFAGRDGSLWAGTTHGLARLHKPQFSGTAPRFEPISTEQGKPMQFYVTALFEDGRGRLWVGTNNGLWLYEPGRNGLIRISAEPKRPDGLVSDYITGLLVDRQERLWVATDKGLERLQNWDGKLARFEHISALLGLPGQSLGSNLLEDRQGRIWTEEMVIEPASNAQGAAGRESMRMRFLSSADGINLGTIWIGSHAQTRDGLLLYGGTKGLAIINPAHFKQYDYAPPLVVTALKINGETVPLARLANPLALPAARSGRSAHLTLTPAQRNFAIEFAALDFTEPKKNRYQYRLQGYDKNWIDADSDQRSAAYGNLWPGAYTLQVRGSNRVGQFSPHELNLALQVLPAWWQSSWFWALVLLLTPSLFYGWFHWRVARLRAKARNLQKLIDARTSDILKLSKIGQELTATLDMEQAFERVYRQVCARLDADVFAIGLVEGELIEFVYMIEHGQRLPNAVIPLDESNRPAVWCVRQQRELHCRHRIELGNYFATIAPPLVGKPMETVVYLPLLAEQQVIGCLSVQSPMPDAYNANQLEFLHVLASYTAIAMSNSAAHRDVTQSHQELTAALSYLQETQARLIQAERQQLSLNLHDNLSQIMTGVLLQLDTARTMLTLEQKRPANPAKDGDKDEHTAGHSGLAYVERAIELAREGHNQTRQLLHALRRAKKKQRPPINLVDTLRRDLPRLTVGTAIVVQVEQQGQIVPLNDDSELALFRIAQESVTNALRHGKAKHIALLLDWGSHQIALSIQDDGIGFDPASKSVVPGLGLLGMQERAAELRGRFSIESASGKGTCIRVVLPLFPE